MKRINPIQEKKGKKKVKKPMLKKSVIYVW